jgi:predicted DNA-binding transcriptional regulator AlpA
MGTPDQNTPPVEGLWDTREVAAFLHVSRSWVYQHAVSGDLPCCRFGGVLRFEPAAIRAYARGERREGGAVVVFPPRRR